MRKVALLAVVACCGVSACSSDTPAATDGKYCATVSASLEQLNAPAIADVVGGHIDWMFATVSEVRAFVQAGRLRALGISGRTRDALLPDVPPLADTLRDFEVVGFMALFGPARLPAPIVERLNAEVKAILGAPDMLERLAALGMQARSSSPEELATRIRTDSALWKSVITAAGISPE